MSNRLEEGFGATTGPALALLSPLDVSGNVWYVSSVSGNDAASPAGKDRKYPLATLGQAVTNAVADDTIVVLEDHDETLTSTLTLSKRLTIIGEGRSGGIPTAKLTLNHASSDAIEASTAGCRIVGLFFEEPDQASTGTMVNISAADVWLEDCYFQMDENSDDYAVQISAANCHVNRCTFVSTEETAGSQPFPAIYASIAADFLSMDSVTLDGGTVGFADGSGNQYAYDGTAGTQDAVLITNLSLLRGAVFALASTSTGMVNAATVTGGGRVSW